jgi:hypothetical protein
MRFDGRPPRLPSALEKVLERLSILDAHALGCSCPACTREGDARKVEPRFTFLVGTPEAAGG